MKLQDYKKPSHRVDGGIQVLLTKHLQEIGHKEGERVFIYVEGDKIIIERVEE